jgi:hypothetical protein
MNRYKYIDIVLIVFPLIFLMKFLVQGALPNNIFMTIIKITLAAFILCLFFYEKTKNIKLQLFPHIQTIVLRLESVFNPIFKFTSTIIRPWKIGQNILIDLSQIVLIITILIILIIF